MMSKIVILALIALVVGCEALEANTSSSVGSGVVNCSAPPQGVNLATCCQVPILITPENLKTCNKTHTQWLTGGKITGMCGSRCILSQVMNGSNSTISTPLATLERTNLYMNALASCFDRMNYDQLFDKLFKNTTNLLDVACNIDLLTVADCFAGNFLLACSTTIRNSMCERVGDYLRTPCPYSGLASV